MATDQPLVSIVVINFNYARFLRTAIDSALCQTHGRCEVIVVDDGSTDGSRAIIAGYGDLVRPVLQPNFGQTQANNAGFAAASGEIVIFLDADDALRPQAAEAVAAAWRPGLAKVQFCLALLAEDGRPKRFVFPYFPPNLSPAHIRSQVLKTGLYVWPPTSGNAFARSFLEQIMPLSPAMFPCMTDGALNTVAPLYGDVVSLNRVLGYYRIHGSSMQHAPLADRIRRGVECKRREADYLRECATELNVELPLDLHNEMIHLEGRLASLKLAPDRHPVPGDTLSGLLGRAVRKLAVEDDRAMRRIFHLAWLVLVVVAPRPLCERLVALRFVPGGRADRVTKAMERLGLVRRRHVGEELAALPGGAGPVGTGPVLAEARAGR